MRHARTLTLSIVLVVAAGCGGGGGSAAVPGGPAATPAPTPSPVATLFPSGSTAAAHILANVPASPPNVQYGRDNQDDGGWSQLTLPPLEACGNGALSNDCKAWFFTGPATSASARVPQSHRFVRTPLVGSRPPTFNFCRDAATYPNDIGQPAIPMTNLSASTFSLSYSGTKSLPIVTFATRWWAVQVSNSFTSGASTAPAIGVAPSLTDTPARGWLLFFTWSWPADVMLLPFDINEIQLASSASPLAIPPGSAAPLGAFDCLGRPVTATSSFGSGFGFSADMTLSNVTSAGPELNVPVYTGPTPSGPAVLYDDRGATVQTPVT